MAEPIPQKPYQKGTDTKLDRRETDFKKFCLEILDQEPRFKKEIIIPYLQQLHDRGQAYTSVRTALVQLYMLANRRYTTPVPSLNKEAIGKYMGLLLASGAGATESKAKPIANGNDLQCLLRFLWTESPVTYTSNRYRVQLALFLLMASFTASRPGAIVEGSDHRQSNESLEYGEMKLLLEADECTQIPQLILLIYFHKRKNRRGKEEVAFRLRDLGHDPVMWPILFVLALAFKDDAFKVPELTPYNLVELKVYIVSILSLIWLVSANTNLASSRANISSLRVER